MFLIKIRKEEKIYRMKIIEASSEQEAINKVQDLEGEFELYYFGEGADKYGRPIYTRREI